MKPKVPPYCVRRSFAKSAIRACIFCNRVWCRLRGVWGYAQDTVPKWACFCIEIKTLVASPAVSPLSAFQTSLIFCNKNNGWPS